MSGFDGDNEAPLYRYRFGTATFDEASLELIVAGRPATLQRKPLKMLSVLLRNAGEVVTREELREYVWDRRDTVEQVINNAVTKLRTALGENAAMILTLPRVGYRFKGELQTTTIQQRTRNDLALQKGRSVPGRPNFRLHAILGRSHAYEVWLARERDTNERRVYKFCIEGTGLAGLKREAALARVLREQLGERDDLVRLLAWNFEDAPYYLESEYGGISLREWAGDQTQIAKLTLHERMAVFIQTADAVGAAHSVGVIHKDLKPSNVLIDSTPKGWRLRIADFGSGRLLNPDLLSEMALSKMGFTVHPQQPELVGSTLLYMAPELLAGSSATLQSDVYALGLILYQLIVGDLTRPLVPGWEREVTDPLLRADIAKATDVDPTRRTPTASQLAQQLRDLEARRRDSERQLRINAERTLLLESRRRSADRAPWVISTIIFLLIGTGISGALYWRAERNAQQLEKQVDLVGRLVTFFTHDFINVANPDRSGRNDVTVVSAAYTAAQHIDQNLPDGPFNVRASLHAAMQEVFSSLSDYTTAIAEGQSALRDFATVVPNSYPQTELRIQLQLASDLAELSRFADAQTALARAKLLVRLDTPPLLRAEADLVTGVLEAKRLRLDEANAALSSALSAAQTGAPEQTDLVNRIELALGDTLTLMGRYADGERDLRDVIDRQLRQDGPHSIRTEHARIALASNLGDQKRYAEAEALATQAAAHLSETFGPDHRRTLQALFALGNLYFQQKHYLQAAALYADLYARVERSSGKRQALAVSTGLNHALALHLAGRTVEAAGLLREQLVARDFLPESSPRVQVIRYTLADCELDLGHGTEDVDKLLSGIDPTMLAAAEQETDWDGRLAYEDGRLALVRGKRDDARVLLNKAFKIITERDPEGPISPQSIRALLDGLESDVSAT